MKMLVDEIYAKLDPAKSMELLFYFIQHTDVRTKTFRRTYKQIRKDTGASEKTIARVIKFLESKGIFVYLGNSSWTNYLVEDYSDSSSGEDFFVRNSRAAQ